LLMRLQERKAITDSEVESVKSAREWIGYDGPPSKDTSNAQKNGPPKDPV